MLAGAGDRWTAPLVGTRVGKVRRKIGVPREPSAAIGGDVGRYRVEEVLGRGGMGVVYRAVDQRLGRKVALKVLLPEYGDDPTFRARFLRESRTAASIDHPSVIPVFEAGDADGALYIAMRYVDGTDLGALLASGGRARRRSARSRSRASSRPRSTQRMRAGWCTAT